MEDKTGTKDLEVFISLQRLQKCLRRLSSLEIARAQIFRGLHHWFVTRTVCVYLQLFFVCKNSPDPPEEPVPLDFSCAASDCYRQKT